MAPRGPRVCTINDEPVTGKVFITVPGLGNICAECADTYMASYESCLKANNPRTPERPTFRGMVSHAIKDFKRKNVKVKAVSIDDIKRALESGTLTAQDLHAALQD